MQDLKIVKILWGENAISKLKKDIKLSTKFDNEIVFVLGKNNFEYLKSLGYDCILVDNKSYINKDINNLSNFSNKIYLLSVIEEIYNEYLFLDWDVISLKPIDDNFYNLVRSKNPFEIPLYAYPNTYKLDMLSDYEYYLQKDDPELLEFKSNINNIIKYTIKQDYLIQKYGWKYLDIFALPCFCYVYSNNFKIMKELYDICNKHKLENIADEFSFRIWCKSTLEEYINQYEPIVINGREPNPNIHPNLSESYIKLNNYIDTKIQKDIYLKHI